MRKRLQLSLLLNVVVCGLRCGICGKQSGDCHFHFQGNLAANGLGCKLRLCYPCRRDVAPCPSGVEDWQGDLHAAPVQ